MTNKEDPLPAQESFALPVTVSVLLVRPHQGLLLGRRKNNTAAGLLSTPGGRHDQAETIQACAMREFKEETGAELKGPLRIIAFKEHFRWGKHYIVFYVLANDYTGEIINTEPDKCEGWFFQQHIDAADCTEPIDVLRAAASFSNVKFRIK